eukprot:3092798-Pleurochrysis_carterae.AAC.1
MFAGPFEDKYETSKAAVKTSYDYAKSKYKESLQKLIDDFGFHPTFKRCDSNIYPRCWQASAAERHLHSANIVQRWIDLLTCRYVDAY